MADRRRHDLGLVLLRPRADLIYYGTGNPGDLEPARSGPGDNKWSMTIMARDPDTGMAAWVYQKTPHDEWDYDGVNENILADQEIDGTMRKVLVNFDRNGFGYTLDRATGELLVAEKYDPAVNWATEVDMNDRAGLRPRRRAVLDRRRRARTQHEGICPAALGSKDQQPAAFSPRTGLFYVPTNHVCMDYEPFRVSYTAGQPYVGATLSMYPGAGQPRRHGQLHRLGRHDGQDHVVAARAVLGLVAARSPPRATSSSTARSKAT